MSIFIFSTTLVALSFAPSEGAGEFVSVHRRHTIEQPAPTQMVRRVLDPPSTAVEKTAWVYGYYAHWAGTVADLPWDRLTHVAVFDVELASDGTLKHTHRWTNVAAEAVALGAPHDVKIHLAITSFDKAVMSSVLGSPTRRQITIDALVDLVDAYGAHGVAVDFEGMDAANRGDLVTFVDALSARVQEVTAATPAVDWHGAYDYAGLADTGCVLFIMGYDYHWRGGNPGPVAPLYGLAPWGKYALDWSVDDYLSSGAPSDKIVLGLPLYGYSWPSTNTNVPGTSTAAATAVVYANALPAAQQHGRNWDDPTKTPYYFPSSTNQTWYDDMESLEHKIVWGLDEGLLGIGFWAVNYEGGDPDFWDMVAAHTQQEVPEDTAGTSDDDGGADNDGGAETTAAGTDTASADPGSTTDGGTETSFPPLWEADEGGCTCNTSSHGRAPLLGLMLVFGGIVRRRRRVG